MLRNWCLGAWLVCAAPLAFGEPVLPTQPFVYSTDGSSLADVLDALGRQTGVPVRVDRTVHGKVVGRFDLQPAQLLDVLSASFGFLWYYDGAVIHVSPASARNTITMRLNYAAARDVANSLDREGLADAHLPLIADNAHGTLTVSGPPDYNARIVNAARQLEDSARAQVPTSVRIVKLTDENAADRTLSGAAAVAPGLATRLTWRVHGVPPVAGGGADDASPPIEFDAALPIFTADAATNSVLIRDRASRLDDDQALVKRFDTKPQVVSMKAYIYGLDARAFGSLALDGAQRQAGALVVHDGAAALLAQVDALTRSGDAHVCVQRDLVAVDHAPVMLSCSEPTQDGSADEGGESKDSQESQEKPALANAASAVTPSLAASATPSGAAAARDEQTSVVIEPDLDGAGSASLFQLVTTLTDTQPFGASSSSSDDEPPHPDVKEGATREDVMPGDALVLIGGPKQEDAPHGGARRLVIVVPQVVGG